METINKSRARELLGIFLRSSAPGWILFLAGPLLSYILVEYLNANRPFAWFTSTQLLMNLFWYYLVYFLCWLAIGRMKLATGVAAGLFYFIGTVNHYVYDFRGRTLFPGDILSIRTAINVAGSYDYTPDKVQLWTFAVLAAFIALLILLPHRKGRYMPSRFSGIGLLVAAGVYIGVFFCTDHVENMGIEPSMWSTRGNGLVLNFCVSLRYSFGEEPEGYSPELVEQIARQTEEPAAADDDGPVNVIAIMNESFADLEVYGQLQTNEPAMPFYNSLSENCIKGWAYSSVFGGTTANSEYEFLTGNTMQFLAEGTVPYQLYVDEDSSSLVGQMKNSGYRTVAMHPYLPSGWNRVPVYEDLGFDEAYFKDDFQNRQFMRNYVTDQCNYENLVRIYEEKQPGEKLFVFNVTMQNHSAYDVEYRGLPETIHLEGAMEGLYPTVDQFLCLMKQSDLALEWLIDYFSQVEEKTIILLFGDHQPQVQSSFFELMLGGTLDTRQLYSLQMRQKVPFCIWANYDIEEETGVEMSLNYLGARFMAEAGIELTGYQSYLLELWESLPVINALGFRTSDGQDYAQLEELPDHFRILAEEYEMLQYSNIFDADTRKNSFFIQTS